jgi:hypothetical protein
MPRRLWLKPGSRIGAWLDPTTKSASTKALAIAHRGKKGIDADELKGRVVAPATALTAIGADIEIDGATP